MSIKNDSLYNPNCDAEFLCQLQVCKQGVHCDRFLEDIALDGLCKIQNNMKVKAKFVCVKVEDQPTCENRNVTLTAVTDGSEENKSFSKYTPSGNLNMTVSYDTPASSFFEQGVEYCLTFEVAAIPVN